MFNSQTSLAAVGAGHALPPSWGAAVPAQVPSPVAQALDNRQASRLVFSVASLLESLGANPYRVRAYRRAAVGMARLPVQAGRFLDDAGELTLPWLGPRLRRKLGELLRRGTMQFYENLLDELPAPVRELLSVPGVGPVTAARLIQLLDVRSVAALAAAARDGRLQTLRGIGMVREQQLGKAAEQTLQIMAQHSAANAASATAPERAA